MIYLILSFIFFKESGLIKEWDVLYKSDTAFIFYTLDKDGDRIAEELKLLKLDLKNKKVKSKVIYRDREGIEKIKLIQHGDDYFLFFTLLRPLKEKRIKKSKLILKFNKNKITKLYELKKKNRFINNLDFIFEENGLLCVFDVGSKIYILKNSEIYEFGLGVNPLFFKNFILFLKGIPEKMNVLFKTKKELKLYEEELVFDKEPVLALEKKENYVIFLTDKEGDLLPEKVYIMNDKLEYKNIYDSDNHIIVIPSLYIKKDTTYVLICASEEFMPDKLILVKLSEDKTFIKDILNKKGIEAKWLYYPLFILLQKTKTGSLFELTSVE